MLWPCTLSILLASSVGNRQVDVVSSFELILAPDLPGSYIRICWDMILNLASPACNTLSANIQCTPSPFVCFYKWLLCHNLKPVLPPLLSLPLSHSLCCWDPTKTKSCTCCKSVLVKCHCPEHLSGDAAWPAECLCPHSLHESVCNTHSTARYCWCKTAHVPCTWLLLGAYSPTTSTCSACNSSACVYCMQTLMLVTQVLKGCVHLTAAQTLRILTV